MLIKIAERLRPFSHIAGTYCVLPGSTLRLHIFPARIFVHDLSKSNPTLMSECIVPVKGPVKDFTVQLDLEKSRINVWGKGAEGYFNYIICAAQNPTQLNIEVLKGLSTWTPPQKAANPSSFSLPTERLSLGNHKSQDWEGVKKRGDLSEILPIWFALGQRIQPQAISYEGTAALLEKCASANRTEVYEQFLNLFNLAFEGILSPRLTDEQYQGFELSAAPSTLSPLILLAEGATIIRSLFFRCNQHEITLLPCLAPQFHAGRFLHLRCNDLGSLDFEWSKGQISKIIFRSSLTDTLLFHVPKPIQGFRLNGKMHSANTPIPVEKDQIYFFDRFQK